MRALVYQLLWKTKIVKNVRDRFFFPYVFLERQIIFDDLLYYDFSDFQKIKVSKEIRKFRYFFPVLSNLNFLISPFIYPTQLVRD